MPTPARFEPPASRAVWLTGAGAMPLSAYLPLVPSGSAGNLSVFPETLMYGGGLSVI